jgi:SAM dependent carboxyl methyltransferase
LAGKAEDVMSVTTGMVGHGEYNRHSATQMATMEYVALWLDEAVADMALAETPATLGLADFGCSEGRNSIAVMGRLVTALRARTSRPIQTIHSDLPTNDYCELMTGLRPNGRSVYEAEDVYSAAVGGSMFDRLLPPRSLHLATTFNAIGFLSRHPVDRLPGYILANGPSRRGGVGTVSDDDRRVFARQARADVESFLTARAAELVPGGKLLIQVFGAGETLRTCDGIYDVLNDALLEVLDAGLIDRDGYELFYQPVYFRTLDELTVPMTDDASPCSKLFRLDRAETYEVPVPFVEDFRRSGDIERYAAAYTGFHRVFTEPVLRLAFGGHADLDRLVEDIFGRATRLIRDDPDRYELHFISVAALLTRRDDG